MILVLEVPASIGFGGGFNPCIGTNTILLLNNIGQNLKNYKQIAQLEFDNFVLFPSSLMKLHDLCGAVESSYLIQF